MLQELIDLTGTEEYEDNGGLITRGMTVSGSDTEILLNVKTGCDDETQLWKVVCFGVREQSLGLEWNDFFELKRDHVLLWPHIQNNYSLWFNGPKRVAATIVGQLWQRHFELVANWFPFQRFINQAHQLTNFVGDCYGLLANGPESLILAYKQIMDEHGYKTSVISHKPKFWDGEKFIPPGELVAFLMGQSYVVAASIEAHRIEDVAC